MKPEQPKSPESFEQPDIRSEQEKMGKERQEKELRELEKVAFNSHWEFVDEKGREEYAMNAASRFADRLMESLVHPQSYEVLNYNIPYSEPLGFSHQSYLWADKRPSGMAKAFEGATSIKRSIRKLKGSNYADLTMRFVDKEGKTSYFIAIRFDPDGKGKFDSSGDAKMEEDWNERYEK